VSAAAAGRVLLATRNRAKQGRLRWIVDGLGLEVALPDDLPEPEETGASHRENAAQKAVHYSRHISALVIASDGGIRIPALGDRWDSLRTRRAAGDGASDLERADHLLAQARHLEGTRRAVERVEAIALSRDGQVLAVWEAARPLGQLVLRYNPSHIADGFWLPAVIHLPAFGKTYAELTDEERQTLDDPWNALRPLVRATLTRAP
jgi:XTP/dITP diphosphohydrolase